VDHDILFLVLLNHSAILRPCSLFFLGNKQSYDHRPLALYQFIFWFAGSQNQNFLIFFGNLGCAQSLNEYFLNYQFQ